MNKAHKAWRGANMCYRLGRNQVKSSTTRATKQRAQHVSFAITIKPSRTPEPLVPRDVQKPKRTRRRPTKTPAIEICWPNALLSVVVNTLLYNIHLRQRCVLGLRINTQLSRDDMNYVASILCIAVCYVTIIGDFHEAMSGILVFPNGSRDTMNQDKTQS